MALFGNKTTKKDEDLKDKKKAVSDSDKTMKDIYAEQEDKKSGGTKVNNKRRPGGKSLSARTLVKPLVTEKAANLSDNGKYAFIVNVNANKIEVAKAVSDVYGVKVEAVNIIKMKGKAVSRGRIKGSRNDFKKAIVTLKKGETIQIYEGV